MARLEIAAALSVPQCRLLTEVLIDFSSAIMSLQVCACKKKNG